jgi:hypothetical protein
MRMIKNYLNLLIIFLPIFRQFIEFFGSFDPFGEKISISLGIRRLEWMRLRET